MHGDDSHPPPPESAEAAALPRKSIPEWFKVPAPVRRVFDKFPLMTYPASELPLRSSRTTGTTTLHVFTTVKAAEHGDPSFNPACLKWQAYLKFCGISFKTAPANNHASPSGALPFILPPKSTTPASPVPASKILKWASSQSVVPKEPIQERYEAYSSLLDHRIRSAWLFTLYLDDGNFVAVARRLYINSSTSNPLVRTALSYQLQKAAKEELLKFSTYIDEKDLYAEAAKAFGALSTLLGDHEYFFGSDQPGLFDASVFAYTHLLLDNNLGWRTKTMSIGLQKSKNLVQHRERLFKRYFRS